MAGGGKAVAYLEELIRRGFAPDEIKYRVGYEKDQSGQWVDALSEKAKAQSRQIRTREKFATDPLYGSGTREVAEQPAADTGYRIAHTAPTKEGANTLDDLSDVYPDDVYNPRVAGQYYGHGDKTLDDQTARILAKYRGKPDADVTVYRSVPKGVTEINPGDWVTVNPSYAKAHGASWVDDGNYDIISKKVKAKEVTGSGDSLHEQGYVPSLASAAPLTTGGLLGLASMSPEQARASSTGTIQAANAPGFQTAADYMDKVELPIVGKPLQGLSDWARGVAYSDKDRLKRAAIGALDIM